VINPVRSARINTKGKKSIKYGKVRAYPSFLPALFPRALKNRIIGRGEGEDAEGGLAVACDLDVA